MKKILFCLIGLMSLGACEKSENVYVCDKYTVEIKLADTGDKLTANLNGDVVEMNIAPSADGARYVGNINDTDVALWNKGRTWTLFINDGEPIVCK